MLFGKGGVRLIKEVFRKSKDDNISAIAGQLSYQLILAFFPFLLFLLTVSAYIPKISDNFLYALKEILPDSAFGIVEGILNSAMKNSNGTLLSFGMIAAIWITSDGLAVLIKGINKAYGCDKKRRFFRMKGVSLLFTFGLIIAIILSILLIIFGELFGEYLFGLLGESQKFKNFWEIVRLPFSGLIIISLLSALYYFAPCKRPSINMVLPGAVFSAFAWILASGLISFYFNSFEYFANTYGSIGGIIILLVWLYWSGIIVMLGAEINASIGTIYKS